MPTPVTNDPTAKWRDMPTQDTRQRKPEWLKVRAPGGENYADLKGLLRGLNLHTVCEEASCPNVGECWGEGTATIMILGDVCTRGCRFCNVTSGNPGGRLDPLEPENTAAALSRLEHLKYVVITSVDRDDLPDGGAGHYARTVREIKRRRPDLKIETLIPDFGGDREALSGLIEAGPEVIAQNLETVRRLTREVRDARASYEVTLQVLADLKEMAPRLREQPLFTKSSLMVGLGETEAEMAEAMDDLRSVGVDFLTIGQYLRPSPKHLPVIEFVTPERFTAYREIGLEKGFRYVASGPLVRSSYRAGEFYIRSIIEGGGNGE
jgi:lipoic acid synthetase